MNLRGSEVQLSLLRASIRWVIALTGPQTDYSSERFRRIAHLVYADCEASQIRWVFVMALCAGAG